MKSPRFWQRSSGLAQLLAPVAAVYGWIVQYRARKNPDYTSRLAVICVGNITMGGSGKTPVVAALAKCLQAGGANPAILLRGYGGKKKGTYWVEEIMTAAECGDEALLHARTAPTLVSADRVAGAQMIERNSAITHILMDDGLQNPSLYKALSLLVIDGANPAGNGRIFPAGPLRESLSQALKRVQGLVLLGEDVTGIETAYQEQLPVFKARLEAHDQKTFYGRTVFAFAGIGNPHKFYQSLKDCGAIIAETRDFPDHNDYTRHEINSLLAKARHLNAIAVTTRKDWVRLTKEDKDKIHVLDVEIMWDSPDAITQAITKPLI